MSGIKGDGGRGGLPLPTRPPGVQRDNGVPEAIPAPNSAPLNGVYRTLTFAPWVRVVITNADTGEAHDVSRDLMSLDTKKTLADPAGEWSVTLNPRRIPFGRRNVTWADIIGEQDHCIITMGLHHDDPGVVVMRGFVDHCHRLDSADPERGLPARRVLISGRDYGKLWLDFKVFYLLELSQTLDPSGKGLMLLLWGIDPGFVTPNSFLADIYGKLVAPKIARLQRHNPAVATPSVACAVPDQFQVNTVNSAFQGYTGSLWNLMQMFVSPPFTEFTILDVPGQSAPEMRWRWAPLTRLGNRLALPWTPHPPVRTIHADELSRYDVDASDNQKFTYLWAPPGQYSAFATGLAAAKFTAPGYIDAPGIDKFGYKDFQPDFNLYSLSLGGDPADDDTNKTKGTWAPQIAANVRWLADTMTPNHLFLDGTLQTHLRPDLCVGEYVDVPEEGTRFYVEGVSHAVVIGERPQVTTAVQVTRGQRLGDADILTPDSYKYSEGAEIPGGARFAAPLSQSTADQIDAATRQGGQSGSSGANPGASVPAPPFVGEEAAQATIRLASSLIGVADYALGRRNIDRGTDVRSTFASIVRPGPQNPAGDQGGGVDCSELVEWALHYGAGIRCPASAQNQYNITPRVRYADLLPGDVVFFGGTTGGDISGSNVTHSGLYIGGGTMINSQDFGQKVKEARLDTGYWQEHFVSGGRVFTVHAGGAGGVENQH